MPMPTTTITRLRSRSKTARTLQVCVPAAVWPAVLRAICATARFRAATIPEPWPTVHARTWPVSSVSVEHVSIDNCTAVCNVAGMSAGSEYFSGGGIVGILYDGSSCTNSSFYGSIVSSTTKPEETAGGIAGSSAAGTSISGCKLGGAVRGTDITDSNYSSYVAGDSNAQVSSCSYWDGK